MPAKFAKYIRTLTCLPAGTLKFHCISLPPLGSSRAAEKMPIGVPAGTVPLRVGVPPVTALAPVLCSGLGAAAVSTAQSIWQLPLGTREPPAFTRYRTEGSWLRQPLCGTV